jgi:hypothetical protein
MISTAPDSISFELIKKDKEMFYTQDGIIYIKKIVMKLDDKLNIEYMKKIGDKKNAKIIKFSITKENNNDYTIYKNGTKEIVDLIGVKKFILENPELEFANKYLELAGGRKKKSSRKTSKKKSSKKTKMKRTIFW